MTGKPARARLAAIAGAHRAEADEADAFHDHLQRRVGRG